MEFSAACAAFGNKLEEFLDLHADDQPLDENHIKTVSRILRKFGHRLTTENVRPFFDEVLKYFLLLIKFSHQSKDASHKFNFIVRMALDVFLFVIETADVYDVVYNKMVRITIKVIEIYGDLSCINEFLRMFIGFMKKVSDNTVSNVKTNLIKSLLLLLFNLIKDTIDVETQAVISEIFLRYLRFNVVQPVFFEKIFPNIENILPDQISETHMYETLRSLINDLNQNGEKIFSILCQGIILDKLPLSEYESGPLNQPVWLDVDVVNSKISFFSSHEFLRCFSSNKISSNTSWEVMSFRADDVLKVNFDQTSDSLDMNIRINTTSFNLLSNMQFDTVRHLVIKISKRSNKKYNDFVNNVLPKVFQKFSKDMPLNFENEDAETSEDMDSNLSSPLVQFTHPEKRNYYNRRFLDRISKPVTNLTSNSIILITSDEDEDEVVRVDQPNSFKSIAENVLEKSAAVGFVKISSKRDKLPFDQSITPISFTESIVGRARKTKISEINARNSMRVIDDSLEGVAPRKISTRKEHKLKMSTTATASLMNTPSHNPSDNLKSSALEWKIKSPIVYMSERESLLLNLNKRQSPNGKVENWLKNVETENGEKPSPERDEGPVSCEETGSFVSITDCGLMNVEEKLKEMFGESGKENNEQVEAEVGVSDKPEQRESAQIVLDMMLTPNYQNPDCDENENESLKNNSDDTDVLLAELDLILGKSNKSVEKQDGIISSQKSVNNNGSLNNSSQRSVAVAKPKEMAGDKSNFNKKNKQSVAVARPKEMAGDKSNFNKENKQDKKVVNELELSIDETPVEKAKIITKWKNKLQQSSKSGPGEKSHNKLNSSPKLSDNVQNEIMESGKLSKNKIALPPNKENICTNSQTLNVKGSEYENKILKGSQKHSKNETSMSEKNKYLQERSKSSRAFLNVKKIGKRNVIVSDSETEDGLLQELIVNDSGANAKNKIVSSQMKSQETIKRNIFQKETDKIDQKGKSHVRESLEKYKINYSPESSAEEQIEETNDNVFEKFTRKTTTKAQSTPKPSNKRKLYNPEDLSYLEGLLNDEQFAQKALEKEKELNETLNIKKRRLNSTEKKKVPTKSKQAKKEKSKELKINVTERKIPETDLTLDKALNNMKNRVREERKLMKKKQKIAALRDVKGKVGVWVEDVSSPSTPPSSEPLFKPKKLFTPTEHTHNNSSNRMTKEKVKKDSNASSGLKKTVNVISNVVVKPADEINNNDNCRCGDDFVKSMFANFLQFLKDVEMHRPDLLNCEECSDVCRILNSHFD